MAVRRFWGKIKSFNQEINDPRHLGTAKRAQSKKGAEQKGRRAKRAQSKKDAEQKGCRTKRAQNKKGARSRCCVTVTFKVVISSDNRVLSHFVET